MQSLPASSSSSRSRADASSYILLLFFFFRGCCCCHATWHLPHATMTSLQIIFKFCAKGQAAAKSAAETEAATRQATARHTNSTTEQNRTEYTTSTHTHTHTLAETESHLAAREITLTALCSIRVKHFHPLVRIILAQREHHIYCPFRATPPAPPLPLWCHLGSAVDFKRNSSPGRGWFWGKPHSNRPAEPKNENLKGKAIKIAKAKTRSLSNLAKYRNKYIYTCIYVCAHFSGPGAWLSERFVETFYYCLNRNSIWLRFAALRFNLMFRLRVAAVRLVPPTLSYPSSPTLTLTPSPPQAVLRHAAMELGQAVEQLLH